MCLVSGAGQLKVAGGRQELGSRRRLQVQAATVCEVVGRPFFPAQPAGNQGPVARQANQAICGTGDTHYQQQHKSAARAH